MRILFIIALLTSSFNVQGQTIAGLWRSPKSTAAFSYRFDSTGTVQYNFYGCLSQQQRKGHYTVKRDSVFILYDTLSAEERTIYGLKTQPPRTDTLYIMNENKIKVNDYVFLYSDKIWSPELKPEVLITPGHIRAASIEGKYYLKKEYYDTDKPFSNTFLLKINRDGTFSYSKTFVKNHKNTYQGNWEIKNDTLYCNVESIKYHFKNTSPGKEPLQFKFVFMSFKAYEIEDDKIIESLFRQ